MGAADDHQDGVSVGDSIPDEESGGNSSMDERNSPSRTATPDEEVVVPIDDVVEPVSRRTRLRDGIIDRVDYTSINKDDIYEQGPRAHMIAVLEALQEGDPILLGLPHEEPLSYTKAMRSPLDEKPYGSRSY